MLSCTKECQIRNKLFKLYDAGCRKLTFWGAIIATLAIDQKADDNDDKDDDDGSWR